MSATPSPGQTPGQTPTASLPPFMRRRKQAANPLVKPKRPQGSARPSQRPAAAAAQVNGHVVSTKAEAAPGTTAPGQQMVHGASLNTEQTQEEYVDYPVFTTKKQFLEGSRYHVMRFIPNASATVRSINPADETQFLRPVKLHRRDPRSTSAMQWRDGGDEDTEESKDRVMDDKERELLEIQRTERRAEREANQAQMAPVAKTAAAAKKNHFQKKTEQVFQVNSDNAVKKKAVQLRYEEALPWHVEDFDSKNVWAGTYEAALSDCHVMLIPEGSGESGGATSFRMLPVEKWYKFTAKNLFKALSIDEAEARMRKKVKDPRWFMDTQTEEARLRKEEIMRKSGGRKLFTRTGERGERRMKSEGEGEGDDDRGDMAADVDDIDYNYEEAFADDEENPIFGGDDDEVKEAEEKIKREQREANVFELKEEKDYDKEEADEKVKAEIEKKLSKRTQKALMKREKNYVYEDDSDGNPYSSESESEDSDAERLKEEERKKAEELQQQQQGKGKTDGVEKPPSAPSSVKEGTGTSTPRPKQPDVVRKGILKRPGSPNLSEASGSESSRKKMKKKHLGEKPNGAATVRLMQGVRTGAGAASDGETSDAGKKKLKVRLGSANGSKTTSPNGSRAASPAPSRPENAPAARPPPLPTPEELRSKIPADGTSLGELLKQFPGVMWRNKEFTDLLKATSKFDKDTKKLYPKV